MELWLISLLAALRPIFSIDFDRFLGVGNLSEITAIVLSVAVIGGLLIRAATNKDLRLGVTDLLIALWVAWCTAIYLIYYDKTVFVQLAKYVIPLCTYVVVKQVVRDRASQLRVIWTMILGFVLPTVISAGMIVMGEGLDVINYWTKEPRYKGAYANPHDMGHQMAFLVMISWIYVLLSNRSQAAGTGSWVSRRGVFLTVLSAMALYCVYMSAVRTTMVGLFVFGATLSIFHYKRRLIVLVVGALAVSAFFFFGPVKHYLFREAAQAKKDVTFNADLYGSGRPMIWGEYLDAFFSMPIDRQVAGIGIGNSKSKGNKNSDWLTIDGHNDFLDVLVFTGYIGLVLYLAIHAAFLSKILKLHGGERYGFLALLGAAMLMNFFSNSYFSRFALAQMLYAVLAYIELRPRSSEEAEGVVATMNPISTWR